MKTLRQLRSAVVRFLTWYWRVTTTPESDEEATYRQWSGM